MRACALWRNSKAPAMVAHEATRAKPRLGEDPRVKAKADMAK